MLRFRGRPKVQLKRDSEIPWNIRRWDAILDVPKANILDKSEPSHLSSILNLLRRRLFDAIQRPQKDIKEKVVGFCGAWFRCNLRLKEGWWLISRELWRGTVCIVYISARLTYSNIIAKPSAWAKLSCQVPSFGSKSTLHNFLAHASRSKLQTVNCVRMIGLIVRYFLGSRLEVSQQLALVRILSWFVQNCQRSISLHGMALTTSRAEELIHRSIQNRRTVACGEAITLGDSIFSSTTSAFWLAFIGLAPSDRM